MQRGADDAALVVRRERIGLAAPPARRLAGEALQNAVDAIMAGRIGFARVTVGGADGCADRADLALPINYRQNRHVLFGEQEGKCNGCQMEFPFKMFEVDHVVPSSRGGTDHKGNLQLLCSPCNRIKGARPMEYLMARLAEYARPA